MTEHSQIHETQGLSTELRFIFQIPKCAHYWHHLFHFSLLKFEPLVANAVICVGGISKLSFKKKNLKQSPVN